MKLTEIIGLEEKHARLLEKAGIKEAEDLLSLSYYQIKKLARSIGVTVRTLDTWQEHVDLMRIKDVSPELANALNLPPCSISLPHFYPEALEGPHSSFQLFILRLSKGRLLSSVSCLLTPDFYFLSFPSAYLP